LRQMSLTPPYAQAVAQAERASPPSNGPSPALCPTPHSGSVATRCTTKILFPRISARNVTKCASHENFKLIMPGKLTFDGKDRSPLCGVSGRP